MKSEDVENQFYIKEDVNYILDFSLFPLHDLFLSTIDTSLNTLQFIMSPTLFLLIVLSTRCWANLAFRNIRDPLADRLHGDVLFRIKRKDHAVLRVLQRQRRARRLARLGLQAQRGGHVGEQQRVDGDEGDVLGELFGQLGQAVARRVALLFRAREDVQQRFARLQVLELAAPRHLVDERRGARGEEGLERDEVRAGLGRVDRRRAGGGVRVVEAHDAGEGGAGGAGGQDAVADGEGELVAVSGGEGVEGGCEVGVRGCQVRDQDGVVDEVEGGGVLRGENRYHGTESTEEKRRDAGSCVRLALTQYFENEGKEEPTLRLFAALCTVR